MCTGMCFESECRRWATPGAICCMCVLFSSCTLLIRKSPLVWTRFIRDSIVCVNAIENSLLETMPAVLVLHSTTGNPGTIRNNRKHAEGYFSIRMCAHIFEIYMYFVCRAYFVFWYRKQTGTSALSDTHFSCMIERSIYFT